MWRSVLRAAEFLPDVSELRAGIRTVADGYAFVVEGGHRWPHASRFADAVPALTEIWWRRARSAPENVNAQKVESRQGQRHRRPQDGRKATGTGDAGVALADQQVMIRSDARTNRTTGASFVQVNLEMAAALHADVVARALAYAPATVADAYAGTGATAIPLEPTVGCRSRRSRWTRTRRSIAPRYAGGLVERSRLAWKMSPRGLLAADVSS